MKANDTLRSGADNETTGRNVASDGQAEYLVLGSRNTGGEVAAGNLYRERYQTLPLPVSLTKEISHLH